MSESKAVEVASTATVVGLDHNSPAVKAFAKMAELVPGNESDGGAAIIEAILSADSVLELDNPWSDASSRAYLNKPLEVHSIALSQSDFADGLGVFLIVKGVDMSNGEMFTMTTGSISVVAQLVKAHVAGWLPLRCKLVEADRPSKNGYKPHHMVIDREQPARTK